MASANKERQVYRTTQVILYVGVHLKIKSKGFRYNYAIYEKEQKKKK